MNQIRFNKPYMTGKEFIHINEVQNLSLLAGDGVFTKRCQKWIEEYSGSLKVLLTHSCTAALEMAALLLDIQPGDEIIMPSYTFVSTANAFVLRGAVPVFVDIKNDTLNLDEKLIEGAITKRTKAIVPVHYAGVACEMDTIMNIANHYKLGVVEDAAQGMMAYYKGRALGSIGDIGAYSFHETKNIISGEGGAILINNSEKILRAEIIREKGTDRSQFFRGEIDKYTWQDLGSSFLPSDLIAAFLWAQLQEAENITSLRLACWEIYHTLLAPFETKGLLRRPIVPKDCQHNGHIYYILLAPEIDRQSVLTELKNKGIYSTFHYVPLHFSPAGKRFSRTHGSMAVTNNISERLIRLPLWPGLTKDEQQRVVSCLNDSILNAS